MNIYKRIAHPVNLNTLGMKSSMTHRQKLYRRGYREIVHLHNSLLIKGEKITVNIQSYVISFDSTYVITSYSMYVCCKIVLLMIVYNIQYFFLHDLNSIYLYKSIRTYCFDCILTTNVIFATVKTFERKTII